MGGHCMASRDETFLNQKRDRTGVGDTAETQKSHSPACRASPAAKPPPSEAPGLALGLGLPDPLLTSGNRSGFYVWWWVFFFIILYKNKSTFRNFFLLSLSRSLARSRSLIFFFVFSTFHRSWLQLVNMFLN